MNPAFTIAWIFLATDLASSKRGARFTEISEIADGINHAVPTQQELRSSISWLTKLGFVEKIGKAYSVTALGTSLIAPIRESNSTMSGILDGLVEEIGKRIH